MEQLVLEQFGAEPPFGGSTFLPSTFLNTPFISQTGTVSPNPFNGILSPKPGTPQDWASFRPMLLYGDFQPHMRTQYTAQYNFNLQQELARNVVLQLGYVGSQGHRLLASHDINPANPQTCLDSNATLGVRNLRYHFLRTTLSHSCRNDDRPAAACTYPTTQGGWNFIPGGTTARAQRDHTWSASALLLTQLPASHRRRLPNRWRSRLHQHLRRRHDSGLGLQLAASQRGKAFLSRTCNCRRAYTWSKSLDWASSFEETVNPFNYKASRALSLFNSAQRFVLNYYWEFPVERYNGFKGKLLDDWAMSGIIQFQTGFPIRIQTQDDNELISSLFFLSADAPQLTGQVQRFSGKQVTTQVVNGSPQTGHFFINAGSFSDPPLGSFSTTPRSICCGPGQNEWDITFSKKIPLTEARYFQFRADIFNLFNKTQFVNPDGNFQRHDFWPGPASPRSAAKCSSLLKFYF